MATIVGLVASPHRLVFRRLVLAFKADATLRRVCGDRIYAWEGKPTDDDPFTNSGASLRLTPSEGPDGFYGPSQLDGHLFVDLEIAVASNDADDLFDLYYLCRKIIYPSDSTARNTLHASLVSLGMTFAFGVEFSPGKFGFNPATGMLTAMGQLRLPIRETLNP